MKRRICLLTTVLLTAMLLLGGCAKKLPADTLKATVNGTPYTFTSRHTQCIKDFKTKSPSHYSADFEVKDGRGNVACKLELNLNYGLPSGTYSAANKDAVFFVSGYDQDGEYYSNTASALPISMLMGGYTLNLTNSTDSRGNMTIHGRFNVTLGGNYRDASPKFLEIKSGEFELHIPANAWN